MKQNSRFSILAIILVLISTSFACGLPFPKFAPSVTKVVDKPGPTGPPTAELIATTEGGMRPTETRPATKPLEITSQQVFTSPQIQPDKVGYKFTVRNPDTQYAVQNANFIMTFFNASDQPVAEPMGKMVMLGADDEAEIVGFASVPDPAQVTKITVTEFNPGIPVASKPGENRVTIGKVLFRQGFHEPMVTAEITSTFPENLVSPTFSALAYDASGNVVGFGQTMTGPLPAGATVPVEVPVKIAQEPASVELFYTPDGYTSFDPHIDLDLVVEQADLITTSSSYPGGVGMILRNPDPDRRVTDAYYSAAAYDSAGNVLSVCSNDQVQGVLFPGERLGIGCSLNLPRDVIPARVQVITTVKDAEIPYGDILQNPLTVDNIVLTDYLVTATVHNNAPRPLDYVIALIVGYDADGKLAGFDFYHLDTMEANETREIESGLYLGSVPVVRVEVFPVITLGTLW